MKKKLMIAFFVVKKIALVLVLFVGGCSINNTPDFVLKHVNKDAYITKQNMIACQSNLQNRVIQVDGVVGFYDYTVNHGQDCYDLDVYENPNRHALDREDIRPLTH